MMAKHRVLTFLSHQVPDRSPIFATVTPQEADRIADSLGVPRATPGFARVFWRGASRSG